MQPPQEGCISQGEVLKRRLTGQGQSWRLWSATVGLAIRKPS